ncbi:S-methyl-5'-thioinosine phosphorylase [Candidatus Parabeggiatoa sp. HSG14]|uniref:S-methyl-5'-thioinosine phosphorylase n=1 Tax=Candidatus Parabeggiatoa sp. HSG14 TaxID=3055593 RepID=UPI0025A717DA|nr:S-methyl-5'-thioinosine phosphorylase [Thiotrichales bacterium HSG14]
MNELAIIGGTGLTDFDGLEITHRQVLQTPYGEMSSPIIHGSYCGKSILFLARHGTRHTIPPHKINYRANVWGLKELEVKNVIAIAAVGSIHPDMQPKELVIPHQLIDYTWSRKHTFFAENLTHVTHIDFTNPYCENLRNQLLAAAQNVDFKVYSQGVYGATQGPRLETSAEIDRMEQDGCDIVGMTGMPEAALARELDLCYTTCAVIANEAAGRGAAEITMAEIETNLTEGIGQVRQLLAEVIRLL